LVLKTTCPLFQGMLWHELENNSKMMNLLVVLAAVSDLRRQAVRISQGISWERTAVDLVREISTNPFSPGSGRPATSSWRSIPKAACG
jgi:hypothetical protein